MHPGELIQERYALEEIIGRGGMAEVWRAHDQRLERTVAIKFLAPGSTNDPEFLLRLFNEAQSVAAISHPHVTSVLDYGTTEGGPFLVMEYVPGGTLRDMTEIPMPAERAVDLVRQVASAAGAAHDRGIVHRDIKPGNILLTEDGSVKLADFGIALSETATKLTATGAAIGSAQYISPEQAMGERVTPAADVYSIGVVLYELLTGNLPFDGGNATAIAISHVEDEARPPSSAIPDLEPALDALVMRCLAKRPEERFVDGNQLAAALGASTSDAGYVVTEQTGELDLADLAVMNNGRAVGSTRASLVKKLAAGAVIATLVIGIGIHLTAQPSVAEPVHHGRHNGGAPPTSVIPSRTGSSTPVASIAATVSPTPTPTQPGATATSVKSHPRPKPRRPAPSPKATPTAQPTPTVAPSPSPSSSPTPAPSPTPTAAVPTPEG
jgi:eukaryotic-like serine/threonine-protein kinase